MIQNIGRKSQMYKMYKMVCLLVSMFCLNGCGDLTGDYTGADRLSPDTATLKVGGVEALSLSSSAYLLDGTADKGGAHSFRLRFKVKENSPMKFYFFASKKLKNGLNIVATRISGKKIKLDMSLNGGSSSKVLNAFAGEDIVDIEVDVHNDHEDLHLLVWEHGGPYGDSEDCVDENTCLFNSEEFAFDSWGGVGEAAGVYWGFRGLKSQILKLEGPSDAKSDA